MLEILENFAKVKVLVVGDSMIDRYWWGGVTRISPEAPVPVVNLKRENLKPGGAANVAANAAAVCAQARLVSGVGDDQDGALFPHLLEEAHVSPNDLMTLPGRRTTVKTRIIAHNQHVVRLDSETFAALSVAEEEIIFEGFQKNIDWADVIIASDYAKGFLSENLLKRLITILKKSGKMLLADPKGNDYLRYKNAFMITPNQAETALAAGIEIVDEVSLNRAADFLLENLSLQALLVTQGENGMTLFEKNSEPVHFSATARSVFDVTGAGDTVIAVLAVALGAGADLKLAARMANVAAGLVVQEVGTSVVSRDDLRRTLGALNL